MKKLTTILIFLFFNSCTSAPKNINSTQIQPVLVHPIFDQHYMCSEHYADQLKELGDALGTDCFIHKFENQKDRSWLRSYKEKGFENTDWHGWQQNVLAPFNGTVVRVNINPVVNKPGTLGKGIATFIIFKNPEDVFVLLAHIDNISVKVGDLVEEGQIIAKVGNNGQSWHPHVHIGAWKNNAPLQIRFDQKKMKKFN